MAEAKRRGYGEDGIYFDHRGDCRDSTNHKTCSGRWRGVVSLGYAADGKRIRKKLSGQTRTEVKDKLKALHSELDAVSKLRGKVSVMANQLEFVVPGGANWTRLSSNQMLRPNSDPTHTRAVGKIRSPARRSNGRTATGWPGTAACA